MKINRITLLVCMAVVFSLVTILGIGQATIGIQAGIPKNVALEYLQHLKNRQWDKAYILTTDEFREIIPVSAFSKEYESSHFVDNLVSFQTGKAVVDRDLASVEIFFEYMNAGDKTPVNGSYPINLVKEDDSWQVYLNWENFLSRKLDIQEPLAVYQYNAVSVSLQYLLRYEETEYNNASTHIRIDINNNSGHNLYWELPEPGTSDSYIKDLTTGEKYLLLPGDGHLHKTEEHFHLARNKDAPSVLTAAPGTCGSVFIRLELLPENMKEFDMILSGFYFENNNDIWSVDFTDVPFRFDTAPVSKPSYKY